jgi:hypothetical protein
MDGDVAIDEVGGCLLLFRLDGAPQREPDNHRRPGIDIITDGSLDAVGESFGCAENEIIVEQIERLGGDGRHITTPAGTDAIGEVERLEEGEGKGALADEVDTADERLLDRLRVPPLRASIGAFFEKLENGRVGMEDLLGDRRPAWRPSPFFAEQSRHGQERVPDRLGTEPARMLPPQQKVVGIGTVSRHRIGGGRDLLIGLREEDRAVERFE